MPARNPGVRRLPTIPGQASQPGTIAAGCVFAPRCAAVRDVCRVAAPPRLRVSEQHEVLCAFPLGRWGAAYESRCNPRCSRSEDFVRRQTIGAQSTGCGRSTACRCLWPKARCSGLSASPVAARRRWAAPSSGWLSPIAAPSISRAPTCSLPAAPPCATLRLNIRMVFQDPYASLNPRRSIGDSVAEAGDINGVFKSRAERTARIASTLTSVGLDPSFARTLSARTQRRAAAARRHRASHSPDAGPDYRR